MRALRLAYLVTHPIQYQAPLLKRLAAEPDIELKVFFESDFSVRPFFDPTYRRTIAWDVRLLDGYRHRFLPALVPLQPNRLPGLWRPFGRGLIRQLLQGRFDALWVHGYASAHHATALLAARSRGIQTLLRDDVTEQARLRDPRTVALKKRLWPLFDRLIDTYLAVGSANADYYASLGVGRDKIAVMPYAVDNRWFRRRIRATAENRHALRQKIGIGPEQMVFLLPARLSEQKNPALAVEAFGRLQREGSGRRAILLLAGDGPLRESLAESVVGLRLENVRLLGFQSQQDMAALYGLADVCLLPSAREPWGLVVNEAMNGGCAILASDRVGAAADLVEDGVNGFIFPADDIAALAAILRRLIAHPELVEAMGAASLSRIGRWSIDEDVRALRAALHLPVA